MTKKEMIEHTRKRLEEFRQLPSGEQLRQMVAWGTINEQGEVLMGLEEARKLEEERARERAALPVDPCANGVVPPWASMSRTELTEATRHWLAEFNKLPVEEQFRRLIAWGTINEKGEVMLGLEEVKKLEAESAQARETPRPAE